MPTKLHPLLGTPDICAS